MNEDVGRTTRLFLLWWDRMDYDVMGGSMMLGRLLIAVVFFSKGYVKLSFGRIERHMFLANGRHIRF